LMILVTPPEPDPTAAISPPAAPSPTQRGQPQRFRRTRRWSRPYNDKWGRLLAAV